jgi:hypothetical protein
MSDFDNKYPHARSKQAQPGWPAGVTVITLKGLDHLGVDERGRLYWDGKPIEIARTPSLTKAQNWIAMGVDGGGCCRGSGGVAALLRVRRVLTHHPHHDLEQERQGGSYGTCGRLRSHPTMAAPHSQSRG